MMMGNWDIAMVVWGVAWLILGTGLIYGIIRVIAAEDRAVRDADRHAAEQERRQSAEAAAERPKVGAA